MKAKELAKFLMKNPNAEVVFAEYIGTDTIVEVGSAELYSKGQSIPGGTGYSRTGAVDNNAKCKTDVIYISSAK